ncbi:phosphomethylpyrimidine synthase ThiC [Vulcanococcus sp. Clear-D1]|uniref:phosphomethylpyrimidine synthase ThiC n=1 Tax=Vulcanococcus sp. Clear-D1 TaxID=2766970 RepID=UPI0025F2187F|nr:phosphomethylpyrimidine synthase ThiC [Vulcanococcus sp. Clear-D1]
MRSAWIEKRKGQANISQMHDARHGACDRDDELSRVRYAFDWNKQFELSLDPEEDLACLEKVLEEQKAAVVTG